MPDTPHSSRLGTRRAYAGRLLRVDVDTVKAPDGSTLELEMVRHPGAAAVVALLSDPSSTDPQVLLIRQYRYAADGPIWEIPAGVLEPGETPDACARRELLEETGARAARVEHLTTIYTTPGFTDERIHLFLATGVTAGEPHPESDEFLTVDARPISRVLEMIRNGEIVDGKSIVALLYLAGFRLGL
jgi:ADP-ribose pyrophosphatase